MTILGALISKQLHEDRVRRLVAMSDVDLKALWDRYDGCNAPDDHAGEDIHLALNIKGLGEYCAV